MAVGFEFQTGVKVWRVPSKIEKMVCDCKTYRERVECIKAITADRPDEAFDTAQGQLAYFPKNHTLHDAGTWKAVTDGNELEFVTTQVSIGADSEDEVIAFPDAIRAQAQRLIEYVGMLDDVRRDVNVWRKSDRVDARSIWVCRRDNPGLFSQYDPFVLQFFRMSTYDYRDDSIAGFPQITGGIRIARIRKLFRILAQSQAQAQKSGVAFLGGRDANSYARFLSKTVDTLKTDMIVDSNWKNYPAFKDHKASAQLRGLVTVVTMYMLKGAETQSKEVNVVKNLFFIMARTDFGKLFSLIPKKEQDHYAAHPDDWVNFICKDMMRIAFGREVNPNNRVIKQAVTDYKSLETPAEIPVTRREWLTSMARDKKDSALYRRSRQAWPGRNARRLVDSMCTETTGSAARVNWETRPTPLSSETSKRMRRFSSFGGPGTPGTRCRLRSGRLHLQRL